MDRPPNIRRFEALQIASLLLGLANLLIISQPTDAGWFDAVFGMLITLGLTLLVSRRRKNWARWVHAAFFLLGVALIAWVVGELPRASFPIIAVTSLLQAVALVLVFTQESSDWLQDNYRRQDI